MPMLLPHSGAVAGVGTCCLTYSSVARLGVGEVDGRTRSICGSSPDFVCILRTKSSMRASASASWCTTMSMPSSSELELGVGDDARDLDDHVALDVETGHLEVDPHQPVVVARERGHRAARYRGRGPARAARVRFGGRWPLPPSSGAPTPRCCARATSRASWRPSASPTSRRSCARSIDEPEWFWDAVVRFLGLPFSTPYDRVLDTSRRHPVGDVVHRRHAATSRRRASTAGPTTRDGATPAVVWEGEDGDDPHAHLRASCARSPIAIASGSRRAASARATRSACSCRCCPRRSPRSSRSPSSARSSCRSSPATAPTRSRSGSQDAEARSRSSPPTASRAAARSCR